MPEHIEIPIVVVESIQECIKKAKRLVQEANDRFKGLEGELDKVRQERSRILDDIEQMESFVEQAKTLMIK